MILLEKNDQKSLCSYYIGKMLSYSPAGEDGYYPCEAVRNVLEDYADDALISGYVAEKYNSRGIYSPSDGRAEKSLAARYKENADYLSTIYPKTAKIYCQTAHCGRYIPHFDFSAKPSPIVPYRHLPQSLSGMTADCRSLV